MDLAFNLCGLAALGVLVWLAVRDERSSRSRPDR
jgi:hypothetical protein